VLTTTMIAFLLRDLIESDDDMGFGLFD